MLHNNQVWQDTSKVPHLNKPSGISKYRQFEDMMFRENVMFHFQTACSFDRPPPVQKLLTGTEPPRGARVQLQPIL